jgi:hypothetical protein
MPFEVDIKDGNPEKEEDKRFEFVPYDEEDSPISRDMQTVELTLTDSDGGTVEKSKADFQRDGDTRYVMVPLDSPGEVKVDLYCEGPRGFRERTGTGDGDNLYVEHN